MLTTEKNGYWLFNYLENTEVDKKKIADLIIQRSYISKWSSQMGNLGPEITSSVEVSSGFPYSLKSICWNATSI
jgi:hypothetical protein